MTIMSLKSPCKSILGIVIVGTLTICFLTVEHADCQTSPFSWRAWWPWLGLRRRLFDPHLVGPASKPNRRGDVTTSGGVDGDGDDDDDDDDTATALQAGFNDEAVGIATCAACDVALHLAKFAVEFGVPPEHMQKLLQLACSVSGELTTEQCVSMLDKYTKSAFYVIRNKDEAVSFGDMCASMIGLPCTLIAGNRVRWKVPVAEFENQRRPQYDDSSDSYGIWEPIRESRASASAGSSLRLDHKLLEGMPQESSMDEPSNEFSGLEGTKKGRTRTDDPRERGLPHRAQVRGSDYPQTFKVLQVSDIHHDPEYAEGSNAACSGYLCCHDSGQPPAPPAKVRRAGKWGDYRNCDSPAVLVEFILDHIRKAHKDIELIYWTGDVNPHNPWNVDQKFAAWNLNYTLHQLKTRFSHLPVFSAVGNHESDPTNLFPPPKLATYKESTDTTKWLYEALRREWPSMTLSNYEDLVDSTSTIGRGGFYSASPMPGLRIVSLNTNFCYNFNFFNFLSYPDPAKQLEWLNKELLASERRSERVHILGHIPPGFTDCLPSWSHSFRNIVARFNATITGMFYGHTHYDDVQIFRQQSNPLGVPYEVAYVGPSITPYSFLNPGYRIYEVDYSTMEIVDYTTYYLDLEEANRSGKPRIRPLYSPKRTYKLAELTPREWMSWLDRIIRNDTEFQIYYSNSHRKSPKHPPCKTLRCKRDRICSIATADSSDLFRCIMASINLIQNSR